MQKKQCPLFLKSFTVGEKRYRYCSLAACAQEHGLELKRLPVTLKVLLENLLRMSTTAEEAKNGVAAFKSWYEDGGSSTKTIEFKPARILMQDFTGVPAIVDLAAMRDAVAKIGGDAALINPQCRVDLVIDHSVSVDSYGSTGALQSNVNTEMMRNRERYKFLKWAQESFDNYRVVPPGNGICHQVNIEYLADVVCCTQAQGGASVETLVYPDTMVGMDSHSTMVNALAVLGWGVGGIEAEAAMLGQPVEMVVPAVVGVCLQGQLADGVTATDLVLSLTQKLRRFGVVGKLVEFYGPGVTTLSLAERAAISNMSPEFGSTCAFFPVDEETLRYLRLTGRPSAQVDLVANYAKEQGLWHNPNMLSDAFSSTLSVDLSQIEACLAGPSRPQDRVSLPALGLGTEKAILQKNSSADLGESYPVDTKDYALSHGDVVIAAITSCTNTSNPSVLVMAGLLAKTAVERGLRVKPWVKTSFAPGSKVVVDYLHRLGLLRYLEQLGFYLVGYGCTTCIGNSGPLEEHISELITQQDLVVSAVLSGNRNFEGRIHPLVQLNWLASPPLVVAFALAGSSRIDLTRDAIAQGDNGPVYLHDIWPQQEQVVEAMQVIDQQMFIENYQHIFQGDGLWQRLSSTSSQTYAWQTGSTYIQQPKFFKDFAMQPAVLKDITAARILLLLGDSVTTDHISPAGAIKRDSPAGLYLQERQVEVADFNSYGSRRGNHEVMVRGTFANVRIQNFMNPQIEGGYTTHMDSHDILSVYDAAMRYQQSSTPLVVFAGQEYGTGSSRDWAAKGTALLGVRAVIAQSFERIHRSNLIGMGVLPCQFIEQDWRSMGLTGEEHIDIVGINKISQPREELKMVIHKPDGRKIITQLRVMIDTKKELAYYRHNGILAYVLRTLVSSD